MTATPKLIQLSAPFAMWRGGELAEVQIAYETWGKLNAARDNAILILTGLSPDAHATSSPDNPAEGWWEGMVGAGRPIDTERYFVICVNSLGSCFGSTGPASVNPTTGKPYRLDFPMLTIEDIAAAAHATVEALGIECLSAIVGPSLGGMTGMAYALLYPGAVRRLVSISSAAHALPFAIAVRSLQREMIRSDADWQGGYYTENPIQGMRLARKLGMLSYRSPQEWVERFDRKPAEIEDVELPGPFEMEFAIETYLEAHARKFVGNFDANSYLYLSHAMDLFDAANHGEGSLDRALSRLQLDAALVIGVQTDILFPLEQQRDLAAALRRADIDTELAELDCLQGHDAFLIELERFGAPIRSFLA